MSRFFVFMLAIIAAVGCNSSASSDQYQPQDSLLGLDSSVNSKGGLIKAGNYFLFEGDSVVVIPFKISIQLSDKAKRRIVDSNETIVISAFLDGVPKDSANKLIAEDGMFYLGETRKEISFGQVATIDNLKFPRKLYDQLAQSDVQLTVNVFTGRRSSKDNLITGDFLSGQVSTIVKKEFTLNYKLIYEDD